MRKIVGASVGLVVVGEALGLADGEWVGETVGDEVLVGRRACVKFIGAGVGERDSTEVSSEVIFLMGPYAKKKNIRENAATTENAMAPALLFLGFSGPNS